MNKVILITGASSGIGRATAELLVKKDNVVYGAATNVEKMADLADKGMKVIKMDITKEEEVKAAVNKIIKEQGHIDVLFNNAGMGVYGSVEDVTLTDARHEFEVNLFGLARLTQLVIPYMREAKAGMIINTSSMGGKTYLPLGAWYHASKYALEGWSDCLRLELKQFNINVVIVEPGGINTNFGVVMGEYLRKYSKNSAYESMVRPYLKMIENADPKEAEKKASPPSVVAELVDKIINTKNPKTRYAVGKMAKPFIFIRKVVSDRVFDKFVMKIFG